MQIVSASIGKSTLSSLNSEQELGDGRGSYVGMSTCRSIIQATLSVIHREPQY